MSQQCRICFDETGIYKKVKQLDSCQKCYSKCVEDAEILHLELKLLKLKDSSNLKIQKKRNELMSTLTKCERLKRQKSILELAILIKTEGLEAALDTLPALPKTRTAKKYQLL